jgi:putative redox protein
MSGPSDTELASLLARVGMAAADFLFRQELPIKGLGVKARFAMGVKSGRVALIGVRVLLPPGFPESKREALLRVVERCAVDSSLREIPEVRIELVPEGRAA